MRLGAIFKPEYFYQPLQLFRRLRANRLRAGQVVRVRLPGGAQFRARVDDEIGRSLLSLGVFDLIVTEALFRLTDAGEVAVDAGANIGYMTGVMAARVSRSGTARDIPGAASGGAICSFEPHPRLFSELAANVCLFKARARAIDFRLHALALSDRQGIVVLEPFAAGAVNRGTSRVVEATARNPAQETIPAVAAALDDALADVPAVGLMKLDVEGHELAVLRGASRLLRQQRIRDIVFEEHRPYPTEVTSLLESYGFAVFRLHRRFRGPELLPADSPLPRSSWEATSFLATRAAARARRRFARPGWQCLIT